MSINLTPELLQDLAVRVVTKFMTKQASLTDAIAEEAKTLELNPEQIKRVIEVSNTTAYLRQLEDAKDRSFEFPIANYRDIMGRMVLPDAKSPTVSETIVSFPEKVEVINSTPINIDSGRQEQEKVAMLIKETLKVKQTMTKLAEEGHILYLQLEKYASIIQKDPNGFEKLAYVAQEKDLDSLAVLCSLEKAASTEIGSVFTSLELKDALSLISLFKEAQVLSSEYKELETFTKRATDILIEKKAFSPVGAISEGIGRVMGGTAHLAGKGLGKAVIGAGAGIAALSAGKTIGKRIENVADLGGAALAGESIHHENPVWQSIHG